MANINYKIINNSTLELAEDAKVGDIIDLTKEIKVDVSLIKDKIVAEVKNKTIVECEKNKQLAIEKAIAEEKNKFTEEANNLRIEIASLKNENKSNTDKLAIEKKNVEFEVSQKFNNQISELNSKIKEIEFVKNSELEKKEFIYQQKLNESKIEVKSQIEQLQQTIKEKEAKINELSNVNKWTQFQNWETYTDGGLEEYCYNYYLNHIQKFWPQIKFEKDNVILNEDGNKSASGTKGDFILKEEDNDGFTFSISFEMKNEKTNSKTTKKIEEHYSQANNNRNKKNCKYSVIVTTLEPSKDFTIRKVDKHENMYIVRPEFFENIIVQLRESELNAFEKNKALMEEACKLRSERSDITDFYTKINKFGDIWFKRCSGAKTAYGDAIKHIDKAITELQAVRDSLTESGEKLDQSIVDFDALSITKLSRKNPTVKSLLTPKDKKE